jgi:predicted nucleic acid-binding protein
MVCYYDSSIILAGILDQHPDHTLTSLWDPVRIRLSSTLLKIECLVGIRRAGSMLGLPVDSTWVEKRLGLLDQYAGEIDCKRLDDDIEGIVRATSALSDCRALDAAHIATALYLKPFHDEPITIVSLDRRLRKVAKALGFPVVPVMAEEQT